jgi:RNA polymerase-binding transcription factor DksA
MSSQSNKIDELKNRKTELENRMNAIREDIKSGLDPDSEEQAVQLENYEVLLELIKNAESELGEVNEELLRLEEKAR